MKLKNRNVDIATVKILLVALVLCMSNPLSYAESHKIPVVVLLKQRPDIDALYLSVESVPRDDRATIVWEYLASLSISSQKNLISFLKEKMSVGQVSYIRPIRICNAIAIEADQQLIEELKLRDDVHKLIDNFPRKSEAESLLTQEQETLPNTELDEVAFNLQRIHIQHAWDDGYLGQGILLANIDTGVDYNMPDLADHLWDGGEEYPNHGFNFHAAYFEGDSLDPMDEDGHGTATSGVALGDGTNGIITGVAPEATLMILKVRGDMGTGVVAAAWEAHDFVLAHGVDVTSMSLGWSQRGRESVKCGVPIMRY